jgi:hypothetical protein
MLFSSVATTLLCWPPPDHKLLEGMLERPPRALMVRHTTTSHSFLHRRCLPGPHAAAILFTCHCSAHVVLLLMLLRLEPYARIRHDRPCTGQYYGSCYGSAWLLSAHLCVLAMSFYAGATAAAYRCPGKVESPSLYLLPPCLYIV